MKPLSAHREDEAGDEEEPRLSRRRRGKNQEKHKKAMETVGEPRLVMPKMVSRLLVN